MANPRSDPFESFREAREQEGFRKRRPTDRAVYANRIARLLDGMDGTPKPAAGPPAGTALADLLSLMQKLHAAGGTAGEERRLRIETFFGNVLGFGRRLLEEDPADPAVPAQEIEMDFNSLFEFMLHPDVDGLKRA